MRDSAGADENGLLDLDAEPAYDRAGHRITASEAETLADAVEAADVEVDEPNVMYPLRDPRAPRSRGRLGLRTAARAEDDERHQHRQGHQREVERDHAGGR